MLKKMVEIMMVALIVVSAAGAYFKWMGALPISVTQTQKSSTFEASGEGKVVVVPDQATLSMGVQEQGSSLKQVQEAVNKKMTELTRQLKALGIKETDIKTTGYNYYPDYQNKNMVVANANVSVVVKDLDQVSPALDLIGLLGLDNVQGPMFGLSDDLLNKSTKEARSIAIEKAKSKAEELAGLAGMKLGRIVNVTEGNTLRPMPMYGTTGIAVSKEMDLATSTPVEPGSSDVIINVTLSYETN